MSGGVNGIVYFLSLEVDCIHSFDLETEEWKQALSLPPLRSQQHDVSCVSAVVTLSNSLVVVDEIGISSTIDLWFLKDSEKALWVKQYSIIPAANSACHVPIMVLEDGKILLFTRLGGSISTYDPRANTWMKPTEAANPWMSVYV
ncbi:hypothetical protein EJB05_10571, partial [Eragrostis curvula]